MVLILVWGLSPARQCLEHLSVKQPHWGKKNHSPLSVLIWFIMVMTRDEPNDLFPCANITPCHATGHSLLLSLRWSKGWLDQMTCNGRDDCIISALIKTSVVDGEVSQEELAHQWGYWHEEQKKNLRKKHSKEESLMLLGVQNGSILIFTKYFANCYSC